MFQSIEQFSLSFFLDVLTFSTLQIWWLLHRAIFYQALPPGISFLSAFPTATNTSVMWNYIGGTFQFTKAMYYSLHPMSTAQCQPRNCQGSLLPFPLYPLPPPPPYPPFPSPLPLPPPRGRKGYLGVISWEPEKPGLVRWLVNPLRDLTVGRSSRVSPAQGWAASTVRKPCPGAMLTPRGLSCKILSLEGGWLLCPKPLYSHASF